jgi:phosphoglycerate dehydrogenase-like enzyme
MNICIAVPGLSSVQRQRLLTALSSYTVTLWADLPEAEKLSTLAAAHIVFGNVPASWLAASSDLRWVQLESAGVDAYLGINDLPRAVPAQLTHLSGFFDRAVAEAALAGILGLYRLFPRLLLAQPQSAWIKAEVEPGIRALDGQRVLLLGAGGIARRIARLLINTLPHTSATIGFLNHARLARLKPDAVVCNVGRGSTLDESALVEHLDSGHLGGAVLDVTAIEPLPVASPLWRHPKVLLTQHTGGRFPGESDRKIDVFLANLARYERGEALHGPVNSKRGY